MNAKVKKEGKKKYFSPVPLRKKINIACLMLIEK